MSELVAALQDDAFLVRMNAADGLGKDGDKEAVEPLMAALKDENGFVRSHVAAALGRIGDESPLPELRRLWKTEKNRLLQVWCAFAVARIAQDPEALQFLIDAAGDDNFVVSMPAQSAVNELKALQG